MSKPPEAVIEVISLRDGKASIEHQIDIHVLDLVDVANNTDISLREVLEGLRYVMDFRLKGSRQPNLEPELMRRLCEGLMLNMGHTEGVLLRKRTTEEADMAFSLFGEFLEEVEEFRTIVSTKQISDLRHSLKIHYRCQPSSTLSQKQSAVSIIHLLTTSFAHLADWRDLVKESEQDDMERLLASPIAKEVISAEKSGRVMQPSAPLLPPPALYFDRSVPKLMKMFPSSDPERGLPSEAVPALLERYGLNKLPDPPKPSVWRMLWTQLTDFMVLILLAASIVTGAEQDFKGMAVLLVVIVLNTAIGFTQEWKASRALDALMRLGVPQAQVIRDGKAQHIDSSLLVPGDIVILDEGESVPADLRLIEVAQLEAVEAVLTGESLPVLKSIEAIKVRSRKLPLGDCRGNAFMTTVIARGRAKGLVVRTGADTEIGRISTAISAGANSKMRTPIQRKLSRLGKYLVLLAIVLCVLVVVIGIAWKNPIREMVNVGLTLAVSVIPEGLVAVVTVTMALGVRRMAAR
ncbi:E1-E2 ATPase-domain-containing protein [Jimgerdemannia flammicorona]|uniref:E1-E2 ATPase-domain-containing protein n=1 Tax=Jimgerdemannia flammicorona TaxID=994334 RepID=A0A433QVQ6_9FUNG|nr:E1-E2 ATPase-domain-containing protein [Jimgerdemannia flammicorona]